MQELEVRRISKQLFGWVSKLPWGMSQHPAARNPEIFITTIRTPNLNPRPLITNENCTAAY